MQNGICFLLSDKLLKMCVCSNPYSDYVSKAPDKTRFMARYATNLEYIQL